TANLVRGWAPLRGVLVARDKYIDLPIPELYDLAADPDEQRNLASDSRDRVQVLVKTLGTYNTAVPGRAAYESPEEAARLKSTGYDTGHAAAKENYTEDDDPKRLVEIDHDLQTATELREAGKVDEAIALLGRVIARRPGTSDAYSALAYLYYESGQIAPAIAT